jgi:hypothetical protein
MSTNLVVGIPPAVLQLVQTGLLERAFHDALFPALLFRAEAAYEPWEAHGATEILMTRAGLLTPRTKPLAPGGGDPLPQVLSYEQWVATLFRYADTIDTHMPTSAVSSMDQFMRNIQQLGLQAGQSINRIPRNALCTAYLSGQTCLIQATLTTDTTIRVAAVNGFTEVVLPASTVRPVPVSAATPKPIQIMNGATPIARNVIGFVLDDPTDPNGPGTLTLDVAVGSAVAIRSSVLTLDRPKIIRSGGGSSVDAIGASDIFTLQDAINATNWLRKNNVSPHEDGYFHGHLSTDANGQVFQDPAFQRLNTSLPDHTYYQQAFLGTIAGIAFFSNNEAPDFANCGPRTSTGTNAFYSQDIGAETTNNGGINVGRTVITGRGAIYEKTLDEASYLTEAGVTGKMGEFQVVNQGITVETDRIKLILRAPINRLQDQVSATWSITTSFPVPTDITAGGPQRYKRSVIVESALDS